MPAAGERAERGARECARGAGARKGRSEGPNGRFADDRGSRLARSAPSSRSRAAWLRCLSLAAALAPAEAIAGAWIAPEGGQEIWSQAAGERSDALYYESGVYNEAPIDEKSAAVFSTWVGSGAGSGPDGWRADAVLGWKRALLRTDFSVVAVQAGAVWRSDPADGCGEGGAELRWLGGRGFGEQGRGFVNLEIAARVMEGGCGATRLDLTAGYRPRANWLAMAEVFTDEPQWGEQDGDMAVKAQVTLVRFNDEGRGVQVGFRVRLDGDEPEPAFVLSFWVRPGE